MMRFPHALLVAGAVLGGSAIHQTGSVQAQPPPHQHPAQPAQQQRPAQPRQPPAARRNIDPKADALLRQMSNELGRMRSFTFEAGQVMEVVTHDGQRLQALSSSTVRVQRPNKLRTDRMGALGGGSLYYDGRNLTFFGKRDNLYATTQAPNTLDATIDFARDQLSLDAPGADLLYSDPYAILMEDAVSGRYMGKEPVGNRVCHHLAYRGNETDWQIWIEDGARPLPCRFVITSKKEKGQPEYQLTTWNWREERLPPDTFAFRPPPGAMRTQFVALRDEVRHRQQAKR